MLRVAFLCLATAAVLAAQSSAYGVGRPATADDLAALGVAVAPDGSGLPPGRGTAAEGLRVYELRCRECHGPEGKGADEAGFVGKPADLQGESPRKNVGSYWPYATTLWDYINRAMPFKNPGMLTPDQVYAVTAYLLHLNGLIGEHEPLDAASLPAIRMPNRDGFTPDPRPDVR